MAYKGKFEKMQKVARSMNERNDCAVKATAIVARCNYKTAHKALFDEGRKNGHGTWPFQYHKAIKDMGFTLKTLDVPQGATVNNIAAKLQRGYYLVQTSGHVLAVHNGVAMDWTAGRRHRVKSIIKVERSK